MGSYASTKNEESERLMKYGFVVYGNLKPEIRPGEDLKKKMEQVKADAEKNGFTMKYWGHPYGVSEDIVVVYKSEKGLAEYFSWTPKNYPFTGSRTNLVIIP